ncbi:MAG: YraN family protein [Ekhidna sp.]|uniref:YraN family protein n=1 Tax=Ekhidna sp. TaxID=2608089 RepID=UPI0032EADBE9
MRPLHMDRKTKGIQGEAIAKRHYENAGCEILETNYRYKRAEIDLIALQSEDLLIFVEVKNRSRKDFGEAESFVSDAQQSRIKEAAEDYIFGINWQKDIRFDIACVDPEGNIEVFEDAF